MKINTVAIAAFVRSFGLIRTLNFVRFLVEKVSNRTANKSFKKHYPNIPLPPDYLMFESFGLDYGRYYLNGRETCKWIVDEARPFIKLENTNILDWACGPARVVRHMPDFVPKSAALFGTDYNLKSILWCKENINGVTFNHNSDQATLPYDDHFFGLIYGISIITHLSVEKHQEWIQEMYRLLKPGGILILTSHGDNFKSKLSREELLIYNSGQLVIRGNTKLGHRTFAAYHPTKAMQQLIAKFEILKHEQFDQAGLSYIPQDLWILRK